MKSFKKLLKMIEDLTLNQTRTRLQSKAFSLNKVILLLHCYCNTAMN